MSQRAASLLLCCTEVGSLMILFDQCQSWWFYSFFLFFLFSSFDQDLLFNCGSGRLVRTAFETCTDDVVALRESEEESDLEYWLYGYGHHENEREFNFIIFALYEFSVSLEQFFLRDDKVLAINAQLKKWIDKPSIENKHVSANTQNHSLLLYVYTCRHIVDS